MVRWLLSPMASHRKFRTDIPGPCEECAPHLGLWRADSNGILRRCSCPRALVLMRERMMRKIQILPNGCWMFTGTIDEINGYGRIGFRGRNWVAHRAFHTIWRGEIPNGVQLDHICHDPRSCAGGPSCPHRRCCNPYHTEHSTPAGNSALHRNARHYKAAIKRLAAAGKDDV